MTTLPKLSEKLISGLPDFKSKGANNKSKGKDKNPFNGSIYCLQEIAEMKPAIVQAIKRVNLFINCLTPKNLYAFKPQRTSCGSKQHFGGNSLFGVCELVATTADDSDFANYSPKGFSLHQRKSVSEKSCPHQQNSPKMNPLLKYTLLLCLNRFRRTFVHF